MGAGGTTGVGGVSTTIGAGGTGAGGGGGGTGAGSGIGAGGGAIGGGGGVGIVQHAGPTTCACAGTGVMSPAASAMDTPMATVHDMAKKPVMIG